MIPYDDLVAALNSWRARQGLPVAAAPVPSSGPTAAPSMISTPASGQVASRPGPPSAPPKGGYQPPPLAEATPETMEDSLDVDESALLEEAHYENEGSDFAVGFQPIENDGESTTMGHAPEPPRDSFGGETELDPKSRKPW